MRIAVVGTGIAGNAAAWALSQRYPVTVYDRELRPGGHSHTVTVDYDGTKIAVDIGFIVYNQLNYPDLTALFKHLGVETVESCMSFAVSADAGRFEWMGGGANWRETARGLFAQPRNALRPDFWRMLADIARFNRDATALDERGRVWSVSLGEYLAAENFSPSFRDWYLLPMAAAIWSSPRRDILDFPLPTFVRFCRNHGLLQIVDRPQWRTVQGGGRVYVEKIAAHLADVRTGTSVRRIVRHARGVAIDTAGRPDEPFDAVVLACHSDQALALLADPSLNERRLLACIRYQPNRVVLHTDTALLPRGRRAWAAWNYLAADDPAGTRPVAVSYLINRLQPLPCTTPVIVTLNPPFEPDRAQVLQEFEYSHPLLDGNALAAQGALEQLQGQRHTWYAGAWLGCGFHEDGLASAHAVAQAIVRRASNSVASALPARAAA